MVRQCESRRANLRVEGDAEVCSYGSSSKDLHKFRDGRSGLLKLSTFNNMRVLPFDESTCRAASDCRASFVAGDIRVNLFVGLSSMHLLWAREHNR